MLSQITDLVRQYAGDAIINNNQIPNDQNEAAISATGEGIVQALQGHAAQNGGPGGVMSMLSGLAGGGSAPGGMADQIAATVANKVGISPAVAGMAVSAILPKVLSMLHQKTADPSNSSFSLDGLLSSLAGSHSSDSGLAGGLGGLFGK